MHLVHLSLAIPIYSDREGYPRLWRVHLTPLGCGDFGRLGRRDLHTPARVKPCLTHQSRSADSESDSDSELFGGTFWVEVNEDQSDDRFSIVLAQPVFGLKNRHIDARRVIAFPIAKRPGRGRGKGGGGGEAYVEGFLTILLVVLLNPPHPPPPPPPPVVLSARGVEFFPSCNSRGHRQLIRERLGPGLNLCRHCPLTRPQHD